MPQVQLDSISDLQNAKKFIPLAVGINRTAIDNCNIRWCSVRYVGLSFASKVLANAVQPAMYVSLLLFDVTLIYNSTNLWVL